MRRRAAGLLVAGALLAGCQRGGERRDFGTFSIEVPRGWRAVEYGEDARWSGRQGFSGEGVGLHGPSGEYVEVLRDVGMGPPDADSWWLGDVDAEGRLVLKKRRGLCVPQPPGTRTPEDDFLGLPTCLAGDGRLDAELSFRARGHVYVLLFGHTRRESAADLDVLAKVLETFQAK